MNFEDLSPLEEKCEKCKGTVSCHHCGGTGKVLSKFGKEVLDLIKYYAPWKDDISDALFDFRTERRDYH